MKQKKIVDIVFPFIGKTHLKCLDVGCKSGYELLPFIRLNLLHLKGIDIDSSYANYTTWEYIKMIHNYKLPIKVEKEIVGLANEIDFKLGDLECEAYFPTLTKEYKNYTKINFLFGKKYDIRNAKLTSYYDIIILSDIMHFLPLNELEKVLNKIYSSLSDNGIIYISCNTIKKCMKDNWEERYDRVSNDQFNSKSQKATSYFLFDKNKFEMINSKFTKTVPILDSGRDKLADIYINIK